MDWLKVGVGWIRKFIQNRMNRTILTIGLVSRFIVFFSAIVGYYTIGVRQRIPSDIMWDIGLPIVHLFNRWDSGHYIYIALNWYSIGPSEAWAFFPLYPVIIRIASFPLMGLMRPDQAIALGGFIVSNIIFFVLIFYFYKLSEIVLKNGDLALLSTIVFSLWPGSLFFSCVYVESLFMALMVSSLYFLERNKASFAMILGFLAGWTRPNGFLIFIPFLYKAIENRSKRRILQSIVVSSPYLLFNIYGFVITGIFPIREWVYAKYWHQPAPTVFLQLLDYPLPSGVPKLGYTMIAFVDIAFLLAPAIHLLFSKDRLIATVSLGFKKKHNEAKYYALALVFLSSILLYGSIHNLHRYASALIPLYWISARIIRRSEITKIALTSTIIAMLVIGTIIFATWRYYL